MALKELLDRQADSILDEAVAAMRRSHLEHYEASGGEVTRERLRALLEAARLTVASRSLRPMVEHAEAVARERFQAGYGLAEVQQAYNALEEVLWKRIFRDVQPGEQGQALSLIGTALGAGKDRLAQAYVAQAVGNHVQAVNLDALFHGRAEGSL